MRPALLQAVCLAAALTWTGCTSGPGQAAQSPRPEQRQNRTLTIAATGELSTLAPKLPSTGGGSGYPRRLFNAPLTLIDGTGGARPYLAQALPQLGTSTWQVLPDGRMETTYPLRPGLTWQDGAPLDADDFVFAFRMYRAPGLGFSATPEDMMDEVLALDASTLLIRWRSIYAQASVLGLGDLDPLPRHSLEGPFEEFEQGGTTAEGLLGRSFWTIDYIGAGPYRITGWIPGSQVEGEVFSGHALGRPKIDRVLVRIFQDENAVLAAVLSGGQIDYANRYALRFEHVPVLRREWEDVGRGVVALLNSPAIRLDVQARPEYVGDPGLLDLRVRRAVAHTMDRVGLNDGLFDGLGVPTESFIPQTDPMYPEFERVMFKYPFDRRGAEQLMSEAGFTPDGGGVFADAAGRRFRLQFRVSAGLEIERAQAILSDGWRRAGFDVAQEVLSLAERRDPSSRQTFPGLASSGGSPNENSFTTSEIGTPANRWNGSNRGGWSNAEYDRLYAAFNSSLDVNERRRLSMQMMTLVSEFLAGYALYSPVLVHCWVSSLHGPDTGRVGFGLVSPETTTYWNIHEWEFA
jgi:peptide/nickel transport system substrate-binding protein